MVPFVEEIQHIRRFLEIEHRRYGNTLRVFFDVEESTSSGSIAPMLLQPLVENAIRYGVGEDANIDICIAARLVPDGMIVEISDKGAMAVDLKALHSKPGIGISNVNQRLMVLYGRQLEFMPNKPRGLTVQLNIPQGGQV